MTRFLALLSLSAMAVSAVVFTGGCSAKNGAGGQTAASGLSEETREGGGVTVAVTPQSAGVSEPWAFKVVFDTHSVELDQDPVQVSVLVADGKEYRPTAWEGDPPGGHHRSGVLKFPAIAPGPRQIELRISEVGGIERSFAWTLDST